VRRWALGRVSKMAVPLSVVKEGEAIRKDAAAPEMEACPSVHLP
jgi:hypothetical protein